MKTISEQGGGEDVKGTISGSCLSSAGNKFVKEVGGVNADSYSQIEYLIYEQVHLFSIHLLQVHNIGTEFFELKINHHSISQLGTQLYRSSTFHELKKEKGEKLKKCTSSSRSPINSSAAECLRLSASSSALTPGNMEASVFNFSHCIHNSK